MATASVASGVSHVAIIAIGISVGGVAVIIGLLVVWKRRQSKTKKMSNEASVPRYYDPLEDNRKVAGMSLYGCTQTTTNLFQEHDRGSAPSLIASA